MVRLDRTLQTAIVLNYGLVTVVRVRGKCSEVICTASLILTSTKLQGGTTCGRCSKFDHGCASERGGYTGARLNGDRAS